QNENNENTEKENGPLRFYSERIQSYDHGLKLTALSFPLRNDGICFADNCAQMENQNPATDKSEPAVFVLVKMMQTFFAPVLPFGFGFAVIDDHSGEVYYHANDQRSLLENFYIETDRNTKLIAAVRSRHSEFLSGIYNAQPHRFYTSPLEGTPWSLIVFYDIGGLDLASLRTVLQSLIYAAGATILLLLVPLITRLIFPRRVYQPLRTLLPNGTLVKRLHARLQQTAIGRLTDQSFPVLYVGSAIILIFILFGFVAWVTFSLASKDQVERLQRFNLLHSGHAILNRMDLLDLEQQRLGISPGTSREVKYMDDRVLLEFAIYYPQNFNVNAESNAGDFVCRQEVAMRNFASEKHDGQADWDPDTLIDWFLPIFNRFDASYLQMRYDAATDKSWYFRAQSDGANSSLCLWNDISGRYTRIVSSHPVPHRHSGPADEGRDSYCQADGDPGSLCHGKPNYREISLFLALVLGLTVLYQLARLSAARLMGLYLPEPRNWAEHQMSYRQGAPIEIMTEDAEITAELARKNLSAIANGTSLELRELRAMLYNRAHDRIINTFQVTPVMWLILGGILRNENGLEFQDQAMKKWIQQQTWRQETRDFFESHSSNLWRVLAPSFYAVLLLGFVLITLSGGKIGDFLIGILPIALTAGIPVVTNLVRERLK
ncbi:MAG: hypothetical protein L0Y43_06315, partial [Methylococcaceae bacterium]|nr:hypothetical protein [Methylococcaceae bacterium]